MKCCRDCGEWKAPEGFPRNKNYKDGRHPYCKPCHNVRCRETRDRLYGGSRHYHLKRRCGIGADDVDRLVEAVAYLDRAADDDSDATLARTRAAALVGP